MIKLKEQIKEKNKQIEQLKNDLKATKLLVDKLKQSSLTSFNSFDNGAISNTIQVDKKNLMTINLSKKLNSPNVESNNLHELISDRPLKSNSNSSQSLFKTLSTGRKNNKNNSLALASFFRQSNKVSNTSRLNEPNLSKIF